MYLTGRQSSVLRLATILCIVFSLAYSAQAIESQSENYEIPTDVLPSGGGEEAESANYRLSDTIGEPGIGFSRSAQYDLNAGYRQMLSSSISLACGFPVALDPIPGVGQETGSGTCTVITDDPEGYSLTWQVKTGSGGSSTGYMINENEMRIYPYDPTIDGTPETLSVGASDARGGGRLSSASTDTDSKWGTDSTSEKWLNVGTGSYTVVERNTSTDPGGSSEILEYRVEIGSNKIQESGTYETTVTITASSL